MRFKMANPNRYFPALLLAVGVAVATPACAAQTYGYPGGGYGGYARDLERRAYDNGYREGVQEGQRDARRGRDFSYQRHDEYRDADLGFRRSDGIEAGRSDARDRERFDPIRAKRYREGDHDYDSRYGSREDYKREYRAAFEQGYRVGYGRR